MQSAEIYFCTICTKLVATNWDGFVKIAHVQYAHKIDMKFVQCAQIRRTARDAPSRAVSWYATFYYTTYAAICQSAKCTKFRKIPLKNLCNFHKLNLCTNCTKKRRRSDVSLFNLLSRKGLLQATYLFLVRQGR